MGLPDDGKPIRPARNIFYRKLPGSPLGRQAARVTSINRTFNVSTLCRSSLRNSAELEIGESLAKINGNQYLNVDINLCVSYDCSGF